jgi:Ca-activated chloride channel family protein
MMSLSSTSRFTVLVLSSLLMCIEGDAETSFTAASFQANSNMVLIPVTVTDRSGKTMTDLRTQDFAVIDERTPQQILSLNSEDAPCSVSLVLDISGSMRNALQMAKDVTSAFLKTANPEDEFLLLTVSTQPDAMPAFTRDVAALERDIQSMKPGGLTALIDTIHLGLGSMRKARHPRRAMLILSDGLDNYSRYSPGKLMREAIEADVQIYTIILDTSLTGGTATTIPFRPSMVKKPGDHAQENQWPRFLEDMAKKTGGLHFHVRNQAEAIQAAAKSGTAIRNEYVIGYRPSESDGSGKWHRIHVKLRIPDATVYAREGYYSR